MNAQKAKPLKRPIRTGDVIFQLMEAFRDCYIGLNDGDESSYEKVDVKTVASFCSILAGSMEALQSKVAALESQIGEIQRNMEELA